jgi:ribosomal protein S18 acetylase RimI-like enzyme
MKIRPFASEDTEAVIALWQTCGLVRPWNDPRKDIARKLAVQPELFLVGVDEDQIIASAMGGYDGHRGSAYYVAVSPYHQGKAYGLAIMTELETKLLAMGCPKINLFVRSGNEKVEAFYARLGYEPETARSHGKRLIPDI